MFRSFGEKRRERITLSFLSFGSARQKKIFFSFLFVCELDKKEMKDEVFKFYRISYGRKGKYNIFIE